MQNSESANARGANADKQRSFKDRCVTDPTMFRVMSVMTTSIRLRVNYLVIIINLGANVKAKNNSVCKHNYSFRKSDLMNSEEVISKPQRHMPLGLWLFRTI